MNAVDFIKKYTIDKAREVVEGAPELWTTYTTEGVLGGYIRCSGSTGQDEVSISDLKRLVESVELVKRFGGIELSKEWILEYSSFPYRVELEQAIADYESIYGVNCD